MVGAFSSRGYRLGRPAKDARDTSEPSFVPTRRTRRLRRRKNRRPNESSISGFATRLSFFFFAARRPEESAARRTAREKPSSEFVGGMKKRKGFFSGYPVSGRFSPEVVQRGKLVLSSSSVAAAAAAAAAGKVHTQTHSYSSVRAERLITSARCPIHSRLCIAPHNVCKTFEL